MNVLSAKTTNNVKLVFGKESEAKEAEALKSGRSDIRRKVNRRRVKKFTPKDGRTRAPPKRQKFKSSDDPRLLLVSRNPQITLPPNLVASFQEPRG